MKKALFFLSFVQLCNCKILTEKHNYELIEILNGQKFSQIENNINGRWSNLYKVDNREIDKAQFERLKIKAKKKDWLDKINKEEELRRKSIENSHALRVKLCKKVLKTDIESCKQKVKKLKRSKIENFWLYSPDTFSNFDEWQKFVNLILPELDKVTQKPDEELDVIRLENLSEKINPYQERLDKFIHRSVNNAIEKCDDTKKLKQIIELIQ